MLPQAHFDFIYPSGISDIRVNIVMPDRTELVHLSTQCTERQNDIVIVRM